MTITFGEVSWNDDVFSSENKKQRNNKDIWLRLQDGSNEMRIVTQPYQYLVHKYKKAGDSGLGQKINCSAIHGSCPLCELGDQAKPRWLLGVISKSGETAGTYKILDISYAVFGQIRKYAKNTKRFGDPTKYDIDIVVDKNGSPTTYYTVQGLDKSPLSAEEQKIRDTEVDLEDLQRRVTPPQPADVQRRKDKIDGVATTATAPAAPAAPAASAKKAAPAPKAAAPTVSMSDDEELEDSFPAYDGQQS